jgi:hypothetical protein
MTMTALAIPNSKPNDKFADGGGKRIWSQQLGPAYEQEPGGETEQTEDATASGVKEARAQKLEEAGSRRTERVEGRVASAQLLTSDGDVQRAVNSVFNVEARRSTPSSDISGQTEHERSEGEASGAPPQLFKSRSAESASSAQPGEADTERDGDWNPMAIPEDETDIEDDCEVVEFTKDTQFASAEGLEFDEVRVPILPHGSELTDVCDRSIARKRQCKTSITTRTLSLPEWRKFQHGSRGSRISRYQ